MHQKPTHEPQVCCGRNLPVKCSQERLDPWEQNEERFDRDFSKIIDWHDSQSGTEARPAISSRWTESTAVLFHSRFQGQVVDSI